jgi:hypothetical protein
MEAIGAARTRTAVRAEDRLFMIFKSFGGGL